MDLSITNIFFVVSIFQLWLIGIFLLTADPGKGTSNKLLGSFFICIGLNLTDSFLQFNRAYHSMPGLAFWGSCLPLMFGPLLYLYVQSIFIKGFDFKGKSWRHFLPFMLSFVLAEALYLSRSHEFQLAFLTNLESRKVPGYLSWTTGLIFLHFLAYTWASLRLIRKYKIAVIQKYSDPVRNNISSLSSAILFFLILMVLSTLNQLAAASDFAQYFFVTFSLLLFGTSVFISRVLFRALRKPEIFSLVEEKPLRNEMVKLGIDEEESKKIAQHLLEHMERQRPFLDPELTLDQLAGQLSIRPKILSYVINHSLKQNFFDFVNRHRVEEAKRLLRSSSDSKMTVLEVLYKVGFNSKSSFNTLFRKYTGVTPTDFKQGA